MVCPNCNSSNLKRVSLIHAAGVYESRGRFRGLLFGGTDGALFGRYRGTSQSRLSALSNPPARAPYLGPIILWRIGFFILMSFDGRGKLSWEMAALSVAYLFLLFSRRCSITSSFAPQSTGDGKRNSCASAAEQFLSPNAFTLFPSSHVPAPRGADRSPHSEGGSRVGSSEGLRVQAEMGSNRPWYNGSVER
jgi:hypothetical protein